MVVPQSSSNLNYFQLLGSTEDKLKFNNAIHLFTLFEKADSVDVTREYIFLRTITSLGALSNNLRAGAFSLLCTFLQNSPKKCDFATIMKVVNSSFKPSGTMNADAESYLGQLLVYKAMVETKYLEHYPKHCDEVAELLVDLSMKKSYLFVEALQLLTKITESTEKEYGNDEFVKRLKDFNIATLDKLHYLLKLDKKIESSETLTHVFDGRRLLTTSTAAEIGILLANCHDSSHKFLDDFLDEIAGNHKYLNKMWKSYEQRIKEKIDTKKTSLEMYYTLFSKTLKKMTANKQFKTLETIVSDVIVEALLKNSKSKPDLTKETCKSLADILISANDSALSLKILNKLILKPGNFSFDESTGSKLVGTISRGLAVNEMKEFGNICLSTALTGETVTNKDRVNALNIYCSLLNQPACLMENEWRDEGMKALLKAGISIQDNVSVDLAKVIRQSFLNLLSTKFPSLAIYTKSLKKLVKCLNKCIKNEDSLRISVTDDKKETWELSQQLISSLNINATKETNSVMIQALELLTCFIALKSIYEPKQSQFNLKDIQSVLQRITSEDDAHGPEWIEVVMDLFLNMLSKSDASNRTIINIVFKTMVPHLNDNAFSQMVDVLNPSYDLGKNDNSEDVTMEEESGDNMSDDSAESDEESSDEQDEEDEEEENESEEGDSDSADEDETDSPNGAFNQEKLQFELRKALTPANDSDNESINIDDLDEDQGRQLDATLSAIFKSALTRKKKPSKRESVTSHFRTRVLDLIETYCLIGMPLDHWLLLIPTILKLANSAVAAKNMSGLKQRLLGFVRKIAPSKISDISSEDCDVSQLAELMQQLLQQVSTASGTTVDMKQHYLELLKFCIRNTNYVHSSQVETLKTSLTTLVDMVINNFFEKNSLQLELMMFLCQYNWCCVHQIVQKVVEITFTPSTKTFKRIQGMTLLSGYFKSDRLFTGIAQSEKKEVKKLQTFLLESLVTFKSEGNFQMKTQHLAVGLIIEMHTHKCSGYIKWKTWKEHLPQLLSVPRNMRQLRLFERMCQKLDMTVDNFAQCESETTGASPKSTTGKQQDQSKPGKDNKKRKHVDARKLKKESKRLRLAAMDGLDDFSFSQLSVDD